MPQVTLPDNSKKDFDSIVTVEQLAKDISNSLAKSAVAARIDGQLVDTSYEISEDCKVEILTAKDLEGLEVIRHSCAHLLAHALKQLYPDVRLAIGPVIDDGFYYDFLLEKPLNEDDLVALEERMSSLAKKNYNIVREVVTKKKASDIFKKRNETYKLQIVEEIPKEEIIAVYHHEEYIDMCRGPHVTNTRHLKAFKLTKLAGAYWKGDSNNEMLQRIYGTAWRTKEELEQHLEKLAEAEKRDHRKLGRKLNLFHFQEEAPGMPFWHPHGKALYNEVEKYLREKFLKSNILDI